MKLSYENDDLPEGAGVAVDELACDDAVVEGDAFAAAGVVEGVATGTTVGSGYAPDIEEVFCASASVVLLAELCLPGAA